MTKIFKLSKLSLIKAVEIIEKDGVIVCPTDTVYGFLADAGNKKAVEKIFKIKKRSKTKPLAIFVKDIKMAKYLAEISEKQEKILKKHWPGKYTFIFKFQIPSAKSQTNSKFKIQNSKLLTKNGTVALRIPKYKFLNNLLKKINRPLAQTSVNISGKPEINKIKEIIAEFEKNKNKPDLIIDAGDLPKSKASKIINLTENKIRVLRY